MAQPDHYLLGRGEAEEARLKRQIADLAPDSDAQFEKIGINAGERILDLGCGTGGALHLLSKRVGPTGSVLGIERSPHFVGLARRFVADHALPQVEVREGDAYNTGLPRASFDGAHMRLVLVTYRSLNALSAKWYPLYAPVAGWQALRQTLSVSSAIRRCPRGTDCSTPSPPIRPRKGSTSLSDDAHTVYFVPRESWTFMQILWSMFIRRATTGDRS